jgi:hypothetical protein
MTGKLVVAYRFSEDPPASIAETMEAASTLAPDQKASHLRR